MKSNKHKLGIEIWSDVICVHCYIAKRNFEKALSQVTFRNDIDITWKSFELAPGMTVKPGQDMYAFLAQHNNTTVDHVKQVCQHITANAMNAGLEYNFDIAIPANSFRAHELSHMAKVFDLQSEVKEALFKAHFTDGKNIDDINVLTEIGIASGLDENKIKDTLLNNGYANQVKNDITEAVQKGIKGVPYYLFNSKHSLYGTQESNAYLEVLERSHAEWLRDERNTDAENKDGSHCEIGKKC